ncbi:MAG: DsbA family protein [Gammaproteobacteria bacterium]|nr:DsbA family protein [Gammaproteobacteria bacterium]
MAEGTQTPDAPAFSFTSAVTVCVDFKNPHSYFAKGPSYELESDFDLRIDWQPLLVAPMTRPTTRVVDETRGTRHRRMRAEYYERDLQRYARVRGLTVKKLYRNPDSTTAGAGLLWVKRFPDDIVRGYIDRVFERYWGELLDIEDPSAIGRLLDEIGGEGDNFVEYAKSEGVIELQKRQAALRAAGLFNVPGYVVRGEIFYGRQHLPMIRWLLADRGGTGPI